MSVNPINNNFHPAVPLPEKVSNPSWTSKAIQVLQENNKALDHALPNNKIQEIIDRFYENKLQPLLQNKKAQAFNTWLDQHGQGNWFKQLTLALVKLPIRSVRDVLSMVYNVIKAIVYGLVHPLKALNKGIEFFLRLVEALKQPETYTMLGAGVIGAALGQGGAPIGLAVGGLFIAAGLTYEMVRAAVNAPRGEKLKSINAELLWKHLQLIPQPLTTGLLTGLATRAIRRVATPTEAHAHFKELLKGHRVSEWQAQNYKYNPKTQTISWTWNWETRNPILRTATVPSVQHVKAQAAIAQSVTGAAILNRQL